MLAIILLLSQDCQIVAESGIEVDTKEGNKAKETSSHRYRGTIESKKLLMHAGSKL